MKKKIFMLLTLLMVAVTSTWAESLTTYQGEGDNKTTSAKLPVYGYYANCYQKGEFVMSADSLEDMVGKKIKAMKFHLEQSATGEWDGNFIVFLKEIEGTTLSDFNGMEDATIVYEGDLDATGETMNIKFDTSYKYKGGDLLIGIYNPEGSTYYKNATFHGTKVTGAGVQGYSYEEFDDITATVQNFVPTTTFIYEDLGDAYNLKVGVNEHGTVTFKVDGEEVTQAYEDDKVTVIVQPKDGYVVKGAMGEWDAAIAAARRNEPIARESLDMLTDINLTSVEAEDSTWTFTMKRADAIISTSFKKLLSNPDIKITDIQEVTYADGDSLKPTFIVKDGETVLQKDVDYTVSYDNNVNACEATAENAPTITITALKTSDAYAGDTTVTFTILKAPGVIYFEKQFLNKERFDEPFINKLIHTREGAEGGKVKVDGIVTFSLSGDNIATVDEETGLVTIKDAPGVIIITATVEDGQNYTYANKTAAYTVSVGVYMENPPYYDGEDPVIVAHKLALLTVINIAKEIDLTTKTDKTANILRQTIADCEELLPSRTITHEELDEAREILMLAIDNLEDLIPEDADADADVANGQNKEDETATGIVDYKSAAKAGILYDLNGRKVVNAQKGVYIMNGKKVVIK